MSPHSLPGMLWDGSHTWEVQCQKGSSLSSLVHWSEGTQKIMFLFLSATAVFVGAMDKVLPADRYSQSDNSEVVLPRTEVCAQSSHNLLARWIYSTRSLHYITTTYVSSSEPNRSLQPHGSAVEVGFGNRFSLCNTATNKTRLRTGYQINFVNSVRLLWFREACN